MISALMILAAADAGSAGPKGASPITMHEAQTLPVSDLAHRVLGAAGDLVTDVDRPSSVACKGRCPILPASSRDLPQIGSLTFYTRAASVSGYMAGRKGLCVASSIRVSFDAKGVVTDLVQQSTVGWLGILTPVMRGQGSAAAAAIQAQSEEFEAKCRALPTTKQFVPVLDISDGEAFAAVSLIHASMSGGDRTSLTCRDSFSNVDCRTQSGVRSLSDNVDPSEITVLWREESPERSSGSGKSAVRCYKIVLGHANISGDLLETCVATGRTMKVVSAFFSRGPRLE